MALLRMAVENYRCFKERQEIELRPITVILGKNNSGKSALTRLPLLLETGVHTDSELPLGLDGLGDDPPEYLDLVYGNNVHRALGLEFSVDFRGVSYHVKATIQNIDERKIQVVRYFEMTVGGKR
ncbi:AAA family ATPase [Streptosporangium sp. NPDC000095]|uniref:AAA family ATPase n=1 Tax=Streptosporangium sp. NPDC000095 TaxID=3366184 RepID=UPI00368037C7